MTGTTTTTTTTKPPSVDPAELERATAQAAASLPGRGLRKTALARASAAIGRALVNAPPGSGHVKLLVHVLRADGTRSESPEEQAVMWLATRAETPTPAAVAAAVPQLVNRRARRDRLAALAGPYVEADGERAAGCVAKVVAETGEGPLWSELGNAMGWPTHPLGLRGEVIHQLARAGWVRFKREPRTLRPGPRARENM